MAFTTTAQNIIDEAESILQDTGNVRWDATTELLVGVNNGCKQVCFYKPDAYIVSVSHVLVAGIIQEIPAAGFKLQEIICNMGTSPGNTPGDIIQLMDRRVFDAMNPSWATVTAAATVEYYMYDERFPRHFLVYPKQPSSGFGYVQLLYSAAPADIAIDATILIPDIYRPALVQYLLHYAFSKDTDHAANMERSVAYFRAFLNAIGVISDKEKEESPNVN